MKRPDILSNEHFFFLVHINIGNILHCLNSFRRKKDMHEKKKKKIDMYDTFFFLQYDTLFF